jgi:hypothetical protein
MHHQQYHAGGSFLPHKTTDPPARAERPFYLPRRLFI